jgi:hypothetical protein
MSTSEPRPAAALGFLTVIEHEQHGLLGGYLVLNSTGRPLEFHCTSGVRPNRAQAILFGPTLDAYLYGEQIGQALVNKSTLKPAVICTNQPQVLALREFVETPVLLIEADVASDANGANYRVDAAHTGVPKQCLLRRGAFRVSMANDHAADRPRVEEYLATLSESFDLIEPFARIHGALEEAQRGAK